MELFDTRGSIQDYGSGSEGQQTSSQKIRWDLVTFQQSQFQGEDKSIPSKGEIIECPEDGV